MRVVTLVLSSLLVDHLYPVLLEKYCTRMVYLLQGSALYSKFLQLGKRPGGSLGRVPPPGGCGNRFRLLAKLTVLSKAGQAANLV
jgi:hypothetical protein